MTDSLDRLKTALADRYVIQEELGAGGMATVYLAEDLKHHRKVAVKVLRPELAAVVGAERFLHEIQIAANLNHPHILTLIDSGEADGFLYYVMPYVQGESLRDKLQREKQLSVEDALAITQDVASAMAYAHAQGVIHRDLKPGNILLHEGEAMVADFGLALALRAAGGQRLTETGLSLGTPEYMSPEQATAEDDIDARSDIYSLGAVLYELLAGEPPHTGRSTQAIIAKLLTEAPTPLRVLRTTVPEAVDRAVMKALAKVAPDRFATTAEFAEALVAEEADVEAETKSIVVLPFENLSPDPDQDYFSDGLTEEVIADLSKVRSLRVISRSSAMTFKGSDRRIPDIAKELKVRYALEGSVRKAGNSLRITAQLIDADSDAHLWAEKYTGTLDDVFDIQERVSRAIVDALKLTLTPEERSRMAERPIDNVQAYECYHRARYEVWTGTKEGLDHALDRIQEAIVLVGDNEVLYAAKGEVHFEAVNLLSEPDEAHLEAHLAKVEECIDKIRLLNPESPHVHQLIGAVQYKRGNVQEAVRHLKRAFTIDPSDPTLVLYLAAICTFLGKTDAARRYARRLLEIDPLTPIHQWWWAWVEAVDGHFDVALEPLRKTHRMHPQDVPTALFYALVLSLNERLDEAYDVIDALADQQPDLPLVKLLMFFKHALQGNKSLALQVVTPKLRAALRWDEHYSWLMARCYALLDDRQEALAWLEHAALDRGFIAYPLLAEHDPALENLRGDSRFEKLMEEVKVRWERFEV